MHRMLILQRSLHLALPFAALLFTSCPAPTYGDDDTTDDDDAADDDSVDDPDADGDGYPASVDCDDGDPALNWDDVDQDGWSTCEGDCDDLDAGADPSDADGDGVSSCDGDCDDDDALTYPGAPEQCDGVDNDCDGVADEDTGVDNDGDGVSECEGDCHDGNALVYPGAPQICDGHGDNDCDGMPDPNEVDNDGDGYTPCGGDCDDGAPAAYPFAPDVCDSSLDNDCDGATDPLEADDDGDGVSECGGDCDDTNGENFPGNLERCDGEDNNCSGAAEVDGDGVCGMWVLAPGAVQWNPAAWNAFNSPHAPSSQVVAAFSIEDVERTWALTHTTYHVMEWATGDWVASGGRDSKFPELSGQTVLAGTAIAAHWGPDPDVATIMLSTASTPWVYSYDINTGGTTFESADGYGPEWGTPPGPDPADLSFGWLDLYNADGHASGSPLAICGIGDKTVSPYFAFITSAGNVHLYEAGWCFEFYDSPAAATWSVFTIAGAPPPSVIHAATAGASSLLLFGPYI
jgi:Putative metal-binding motif